MRRQVVGKFYINWREMKLSDEAETNQFQQKNTVTKSRTFRHVGDDDADEEDDGVEPVVAQDEGDHEEAYSKENGDRGDLKVAGGLPRTDVW